MISIRARLLVPLSLVLIVGAGGCSTFAPVQMDSVAPGSFVRVSLTRDGLERVRASGEPAFRDMERPLVEGTVVERSQTEVSMMVPVVVRESGLLRSTLSQQIGLPVGEIVAVETRRLSGTRTALASALVVGAAALALRVILGEAVHRSRPEPTYPQDTWLPLPGYGGGW